MRNAAPRHAHTARSSPWHGTRAAAVIWARRDGDNQLTPCVPHGGVHTETEFWRLWVVRLPVWCCQCPAAAPSLTTHVAPASKQSAQDGRLPQSTLVLVNRQTSAVNGRRRALQIAGKAVRCCVAVCVGVVQCRGSRSPPSWGQGARPGGSGRRAAQKPRARSRLLFGRTSKTAFLHSSPAHQPRKPRRAAPRGRVQGAIMDHCRAGPADSEDEVRGLALVALPHHSHGRGSREGRGRRRRPAGVARGAGRCARLRRAPPPEGSCVAAPKRGSRPAPHDPRGQAKAARVAEALGCPCVADLKRGPCGPSFVSAFSCFHLSRAEPRGCDCLAVNLAFAVG